MSDTMIIFLMLIMWIQGLAVGYIIWAPKTNFKQGFVNGLSLKFLWDWNKK